MLITFQNVEHCARLVVRSSEDVAAENVDAQPDEAMVDGSTEKQPHRVYFEIVCVRRLQAGHGQQASLKEAPDSTLDEFQKATTPPCGQTRGWPDSTASAKF